MISKENRNIINKMIDLRFLNMDYTSDQLNDLYNRVEEVEKLVRNAGGLLASRQTIATIVANWKKDHGIN